jgi:serine/threonine-protein kinase
LQGTISVADHRAEQLAGVAVGQVLADKYRVERVLGAGGMGVVVAAYHVQLDERVAIKFLLPDMLVDAEAVTRFTREARAAVKIKSEHVARIFDVGVLETGAPYIVMEFLEGSDLAAWIRQRGPLPIGQAVDFVLQACVAVAEAHALGIVHRDLKPANLFCVRRADGRLVVKVLDFGISKMTSFHGSTAGSSTKTNAIMGSPQYMSPEQMQSSKDVDGRSDLWALGVVLYELIAGRVPFSGATFPEIVMKVAASEPAPLRDIRSEVPQDLENVIRRCLQKSAAARYPNVAELASALLPFAPQNARVWVERIAGTIQAAGMSASALALAESPDSRAVATGGTLPTVGTTVVNSPRATSVAVAIGIVAAMTVAATAGIVYVTRKPSGVDVAPARAFSEQPSSPPFAAQAPPSSTKEPPVAALAPAPSPEPAAVARTPSPSAQPKDSDTASAPPRNATKGASSDPIKAHLKAPAPSPIVAATAPPFAATAAASTPTASMPPAAPNCDPPYTIDSAGHRNYKPECP